MGTIERQNVVFCGDDCLTQLGASYIHGGHLDPGVKAGVIAPHLPAGRAVRKLSSCQIQSGVYRDREEEGKEEEWERMVVAHFRGDTI